jgi:hypothetical protein
MRFARFFLFLKKSLQSARPATKKPGKPNGVQSSKPVPEAWKIFRYAAAFEEASGLIAGPMKQKGRTLLMIPWGTLSSFALELYLKCLLVLEHGSTPPQEHNLKELFRLLPRQTRHALEARHDKILRKDAVAQQLKASGVKMQLLDMIEEAQDSFTRFRYAYEGFEGGSSFRLNVFMWCVKQRIFKLCPDWKALPEAETSKSHAHGVSTVHHREIQ